ncbi:hypothetical protein CVS40_10645 [Lucilia cuprina]|nr:hypothetical protein CVS40_10645 [Lucilia cuprina]
MEMSMERDSSALGSLFQQIINDMKIQKRGATTIICLKCRQHLTVTTTTHQCWRYINDDYNVVFHFSDGEGDSRIVGGGAIFAPFNNSL